LELGTSVTIEIGYGLDGLRIIFLTGAWYLSLLKGIQTGSQLLSYLSSGHQCSFSGVWSWVLASI